MHFCWLQVQLGPLQRALSFRAPDRGAAGGFSRGDRDWEYDKLSHSAEASRHLFSHPEKADAKCLSAYSVALDARHRANQLSSSPPDAIEVLPTDKVYELLTL